MHSMTGFASVTTEFDGGSFTLELRSVNYRYLDLQLRLPDELRALEFTLRELITSRLTRGKVECRIDFSARPGEQNMARINPAMLRQLAQWNSEVRDILPGAGSLTVAEVLRWNNVLQSTSLSQPDALHKLVLQSLQQTLGEFSAARAREGEKLQLFLTQRIGQIEALCATVAPRIPTAIAAYEEKLVARLRQAMQGGDDERLCLEINLFASKIDVDEELSRLQAHVAEVQRVLVQDGPIGKRLDFMMQELQRETNTLGAKSVDAEVSRSSMEMKLLIEQMREQIQNIE